MCSRLSVSAAAKLLRSQATPIIIICSIKRKESRDDGFPLLHCHEHGLGVGLGRHLSVKADAEELNGVFNLDHFPVDHDGHVAQVVTYLARSLK
jgi:hypothetical protein